MRKTLRGMKRYVPLCCLLLVLFWEMNGALRNIGSFVDEK